MWVSRTAGASIVALGLFVGVSGSALAGADSGGPMPVAGKDGGMAPAAMVPAGVGGPSAPAAVTGASKDSAGMAPSAMAPSGMAPSGMAPASVAGAPGRAGGIDPTLLGTLLSGTGLLALGSGLVWHRKRS
jgi:hypothetical protein